ncbi:MAG: glycine zipper 2TM domain-containing protein [Alphaproteobacteria bacterium]|nr:glycine zipper 2TM domain-containing protein [Alphaproteobacteria bacterium]
MKQFSLMVMILAVFSLSACETLQGRGNKELVGGGTGALLGGLLGSQVGGGSGSKWATGVGVLLGALVGSEVGRSLDKADMVYAGQANVQAHSSAIGEPISWNNPESGNSGTVTAIRDGYSSSGRYCREYSQEIIVGGNKQEAYGTACQQPDGSWEIVN